MTKPAFWTLLILVTGCATFGDMERGLESLKQKDASVAFDVLGYPSMQQKFDHDTVYTWQINNSGILVLPQTSTVSGNVGGVPVYGTTTSSQIASVSYNCQVKVIADWQGKIKSWEYYGNYGGCKPYIARLKSYGNGKN